MRCKWLGMILGLFGLACQSQPKMEPAPNNNTLLWEVSGKDLTTPSYFFGTMHILCPEDAKLPVAVQKLLSQIKQLYFEVDIDDMTELFGSMKAMNMQNGIRLDELLLPADYEKVKTYFEGKSPLPFKMIENYKPMLLASMLQEQMLPCKSTNGMELIILNESSKLKIDAKGLETMSFQAGLFDSIPYKEQAEELVKALDSLDTQKGQIDSLMQTYRAQDLEAIERLTATSDGPEGKYMDLLLYNRNRNWVAQFDSIASKGATLFAVGAGHLPGQNGVLELLRKKGYTVTPLKNN
jgi:uncharacterized protein YbaP (TraB family)